MAPNLPARRHPLLETAPAGDAMGVCVTGGGRPIITKSGGSTLGIEGRLARKASEKVDTLSLSAAALGPKAKFAPIHIKAKRTPESTRRRRLTVIQQFTVLHRQRRPR